MAVEDTAGGWLAPAEATRRVRFSRNPEGGSRRRLCEAQTAEGCQREVAWRYREGGGKLVGVSFRRDAPAQSAGDIA